MKKYILVILAVIGVIFTSCKAKPEKRYVDDIFHDAIDVLLDTTATAQQVLAVMNEYADSLYSELVNSPISEVGWRAHLQKRATDAMSICVDRLSEKKDIAGCSELISKFNRVLTEWMVSNDSPDAGLSYSKEVLFVANKGTDHESDEIVRILVWPEEDPMSLVIIPGGEEDASLVAMFCHRAPEGSDQLVDINTGVTLEPDSFSRDGGRRWYEFHGCEFYDRMMENEYLIVLYSAGADNYESVMVRLDRFHEQVRETAGI